MKYYNKLGIWSASSYFGNFIGPTASGFLVEAYGFEWTSMVFFGLYGFILLVDICELTYHVKRSKDSLSYAKLPKNDKHEDVAPLLESNR